MLKDEPARELLPPADPAAPLIVLDSYPPFVEANVKPRWPLTEAVLRYLELRDVQPSKGVTRYIGHHLEARQYVRRHPTSFLPRLQTSEADPTHWWWGAPAAAAEEPLGTRGGPSRSRPPLRPKSGPKRAATPSDTEPREEGPTADPPRPPLSAAASRLQMQDLVVTDLHAQPAKPRQSARDDALRDYAQLPEDARRSIQAVCDLVEGLVLTRCLKGYHAQGAIGVDLLGEAMLEQLATIPPSWQAAAAKARAPPDLDPDDDDVWAGDNAPSLAAALIPSYVAAIEGVKLTVDRVNRIGSKGGFPPFASELEYEQAVDAALAVAESDSNLGDQKTWHPEDLEDDGGEESAATRSQSNSGHGREGDSPFEVDETLRDSGADSLPPGGGGSPAPNTGDDEAGRAALTVKPPAAADPPLVALAPGALEAPGSRGLGVPALASVPFCPRRAEIIAHGVCHRLSDPTPAETRLAEEVSALQLEQEVYRRNHAGLPGQGGGSTQLSSRSASRHSLADQLLGGDVSVDNVTVCSALTHRDYPPPLSADRAARLALVAKADADRVEAERLNVLRLEESRVAAGRVETERLRAELLAAEREFLDGLSSDSVDPADAIQDSELSSDEETPTPVLTGMELSAADKAEAVRYVQKSVKGVKKNLPPGSSSVWKLWVARCDKLQSHLPPALRDYYLVSSASDEDRRIHLILFIKACAKGGLRAKKARAAFFRLKAVFDLNLARCSFFLGEVIDRALDATSLTVAEFKRARALTAVVIPQMPLPVEAIEQIRAYGAHVVEEDPNSKAASCAAACSVALLAILTFGGRPGHGTGGADEIKEPHLIKYGEFKFSIRPPILSSPGPAGGHPPGPLTPAPDIVVYGGGTARAACKQLKWPPASVLREVSFHVDTSKTLGSCRQQRSEKPTMDIVEPFVVTRGTTAVGDNFLDLLFHAECHYPTSPNDPISLSFRRAATNDKARKASQVATQEADPVTGEPLRIRWVRRHIKDYDLLAFIRGLVTSVGADPLHYGNKSPRVFLLAAAAALKLHPDFVNATGGWKGKEVPYKWYLLKPPALGLLNSLTAENLADASMPTVASNQARVDRIRLAAVRNPQVDGTQTRAADVYSVCSTEHPPRAKRVAKKPAASKVKSAALGQSPSIPKRSSLMPQEQSDTEEGPPKKARATGDAANKRVAPRAVLASGLPPSTSNLTAHGTLIIGTGDGQLPDLKWVVEGQAFPVFAGLKRLGELLEDRFFHEPSSLICNIPGHPDSIGDDLFLRPGHLLSYLEPLLRFKGFVVPMSDHPDAIKLGSGKMLVATGCLAHYANSAHRLFCPVEKRELSNHDNNCHIHVFGDEVTLFCSKPGGLFNASQPTRLLWPYGSNYPYPTGEGRKFENVPKPPSTKRKHRATATLPAAGSERLVVPTLPLGALDLTAVSVKAPPDGSWNLAGAAPAIGKRVSKKINLSIPSGPKATKGAK